jgi:hypothetical protein
MRWSVRRSLALAASVVTVAAGLAAPGEAAVTQTFTTAQSPFPPDAGGRGGPNQGYYYLDYLRGVTFERGPYPVSRGRIGQNNFFTFDLRPACAASEVTLQLVRGSEAPAGGQTGTADYAMHQVTTPAGIVNTPGGSPWSLDTFTLTASGVWQDLEDGTSYGEASYPLEGLPSDVLSFRLNPAGVAGFNAARGDFFTVGGTGGGRRFVAGNQFIYRNPIFSGVSDPGKLVVTCALPTSKAQCKNGGWRDFPDFENQGDCVSFVATGGKNPPANNP